MINLESLSVWTDISARLLKITPAQIAAAERRLTAKRKKNEVMLGIVESQTTRALYTLGVLLGVESIRTEAEAKGCDEELVERDLREKAAVLDMFEDVAKELFWAQAKLDVGCHQVCNVGLRQGWLLVKNPPSPGPGDVLAAMIHHGGGEE